MMHIRVTILGRDGRPQGSTWSSVTPSTPTFSPSKFTPGTQQSSWKPFQPPGTTSNEHADVIQGSVKVDPSGGYVHTFGAPKRESTPQTASSNASGMSPFQNYQAPPFQESSPTPRYTQQIIIPTNDISNQYGPPARQVSYQSNASQQSPVQQSPVQSSPVFYQPQSNNFDNRPNGTSNITYNTPRQMSTPYQTTRQESVPYQGNSWSSPPVRQDSMSYQPSRQDSWNQPVQQVTKAYSPSRQDSWSNQPAHQNSNQSVFNRQDSNRPAAFNSPSSPNRQESWSNEPIRQNINQQPSRQESVRGLFNHQNSISPSPSEQAVRYGPVASNSGPGFQRQSSIQYQPSSKPYSPTSHSPGGNQPPNFGAANNANSPYSYGVPGPFPRQQSSASQPWSPGPVESFPTPPPLTPSSESACAAWPSPSELPTPPPPPSPPSSQVPPPPPPVAAPPPPPPPPPPMPSSAGTSQEMPAWKKQIKATKDAKAAAGIPPETPGTPSGVPELPAALAGSMKKDKKPFTYLPGGLDLSEIRSPKMQKRIIANQQQAPPPPSCMGQQVLLQPRTNGAQSQQLPNQFNQLNLGEQHQQQSGDNRMATAVEPQRRPSADGQDPRNYGQSRSFRIIQMMTGGDDATDSTPPPQPMSAGKKDEDEMRFTGLRRPDNPIPSRAFQQLQKMTSGQEEAAPVDTQYRDGSVQDPQADEGPVDIRYRGGYIPGRSFKMLQEMTGMNEDGTPTGTVVPSVLQEKRQQRKPLHLAINQPQSPPPPKQFPQPSVPASQQHTEEAPKMYTGGRIPSQSFRMLQAMTGQNNGEDGTDM